MAWKHERLYDIVQSGQLALQDLPPRSRNLQMLLLGRKACVIHTPLEVADFARQFDKDSR